MSKSPHKWGVFMRIGLGGYHNFNPRLVSRHKTQVAAKARSRAFDQYVRRLTAQERNSSGPETRG